jgi:nucleotide-binding universal stress UspA family protein
MSYKTILVDVDESRHVDARIAVAAHLANAENAHLIGAAMTGVSRFLYQSMAFKPADPSTAPYLERMQQRAHRALEKFDSIARGIGVASFERRLVDDEAAGGLSLQGRYADLVVIGQHDPDEPHPTINSYLPEYVVMNCGCPALVIPYTSARERIGDRVLIAWNASMEATRAVHSAIPLLRLAKTVEVAVFNAEAEVDAHGRQPGADIALYLARHGIKVDVITEKTESDVGNALLSLAANLSSDLLVMGCYGHARFREILLGGVSRTIFDSMTLPVVTSH